MNVLRYVQGKNEKEQEILKRIYQGLYLAIVCYAAGAWGDKLDLTSRKKLASGQRKPLIGITKAYRTTSTDALQVVSGLAPLDLEIERRWAAYMLRKTGRVEWRGRNIVGVRRRAEMRNALSEIWQERWIQSEKGRYTYKYMPEVGNRESMKWVVPDYYITQALTGHGNFRAKLASFGFGDEELCSCGAIESAGHVILECANYGELRTSLFETIERLGLPNEETIMLRQDCYGTFQVMARTILKRKEEMERRRREVREE